MGAQGYMDEAVDEAFQLARQYVATQGVFPPYRWLQKHGPYSSLSSVLRLVGEMERRGLVRRVQVGSKRRWVLLDDSPAGELERIVWKCEELDVPVAAVPVSLLRRILAERRSLLS